ncbi:MAG: glycoside hydrolase family 31 protein, partial [Pirellulaceae bacterium]
EEERRVDDEVREADAHRDEEKMVFAEGHEEDEHLQGQRRLDGLTKREEPWFEHLTEFVYEGAHWFKQDGAYQCLEHPDRLWGADLPGGGMTDEQMHNLYPLLYSKQMYLGFRETDERDSGIPERTFPFTPDGWAGLQRWTGTWTGDTGGGEEPLVACGPGQQWFLHGDDPNRSRVLTVMAWDLNGSRTEPVWVRWPFSVT